MRTAVGLHDATKPTGEVLSSELVEQAANRMGRLGLVIAGTLLAFQLLTLVLGLLGKWQPAPDAWRGRLTALGVGLLSLIAYGLSRSRALRAKAAVWGSAYQLLGASCMAISQYWGDHSVLLNNSDSAFLAVWIVLFPLIVPASPTHNGSAAFGCAALPVLVHFLWCGWAGHPLPSGQLLWSTFLPYGICAALALGAAKISYQLKVTASEAQRELRTLGSYRLVARLDEGGMGEVWRAEHSLLARPAAIKLIKAEALSEDSQDDRAVVIARFEREARITARLESPHTISLYDFGTTEDGDFYYAMELLRGLDLERLVERFGPLPPARAIAILRQACESLAEAHALGLVHRDIKPSNIYLCRRGRIDDFVKVLDFGLAGKTRRAADAARITGKGFVLGTAAYMPLEQARGDDVDGTADLYALGCVGYWLLSGRLVFEGSAIDVLVGHASEAPPPLATYARQPVPAQLESLLRRCLAKRPEDRPESADALLRDLEACAARFPWTQADASRWWGEHTDAIEPRLDRR